MALISIKFKTNEEYLSMVLARESGLGYIKVGGASLYGIIPLCYLGSKFFNELFKRFFYLDGSQWLGYFTLFKNNDD